MSSPSGSRPTTRSAHAFRGASAPRKSSAQRRREIEARIERKRIAWEAGAVTDEAAFRREVAELRLQAEGLSDAPQRPERHGTTLSSLVDRWDEMRADQRQSLLKTLFDELVVRDGKIEAARPKPDWLPILEERFASCPAWGLVGIDHIDGLRLQMTDGLLRRAPPYMLRPIAR